MIHQGVRHLHTDGEVKRVFVPEPTPNQTTKSLCAVQPGGLPPFASWTRSGLLSPSMSIQAATARMSHQENGGKGCAGDGRSPSRTSGAVKHSFAGIVQPTAGDGIGTASAKPAYGVVAPPSRRLLYRKRV